MSEDITVTSTGLQTVQLSEAAAITAGDNLGYYTHSYGVIDFAYQGTHAALWEGENSGKPAVGDPFINMSGAAPPTSSNRIYSMNATIRASSPDVCKHGGWKQYGYKNQGQCIASIVANESAGK